MRPLAVVLALASLVARAGAQPGDDAVTWTAPSGCPDAADVRARIERRIGRQLAAPVTGVIHGVTVAVATERVAGEPRFVARIDLGSVASEGRERRVLTSARCDELADAVALVIARIAAEAPPPAAPVLAAAPMLRRAPEARPWGGGLRVDGISGIGALPGVGLAGGLTGYVRARSLLVELAAVRWLPGSHALRAGAVSEIRVSLDAMVVRFGWSPEGLPLRAWLAGELGTMRGEDMSEPTHRLAGDRWIAAGAGFAVAWPVLEHARLVGMIDVAVPARRARVLSDGSAQYGSGPATVRSGLGVEVGWW